MSGRGVVLLHDINVREGDFGAWRFWERVQEQYPSIAFLHGHGLGVLGLGADLPEPVAWLLSHASADPRNVMAIRTLFARLGGIIASRYAEQSLRAEVAEKSARLTGAYAEVERLTALAAQHQEARRLLDGDNGGPAAAHQTEATAELTALRVRVDAAENAQTEMRAQTAAAQTDAESARAEIAAARAEASAACSQRDIARIAARRAAAASEGHWRARITELEQRAAEAAQQAGQAARQAADAEQQAATAQQRAVDAEQQVATAQQRAVGAEQQAAQWRHQYRSPSCQAGEVSATLLGPAGLSTTSGVRAPVRAGTIVVMGTPVTLRGVTPSVPVTTVEDREVLAASGLLDDARYRARAGLADEVDLAAHYLEQGWLQGLDPREGFEGEFLRPYLRVVWPTWSAGPGLVGAVGSARPARTHQPRGGRVARQPDPHQPVLRC